MTFALPIYATKYYGKKTEAFGTKIVQLIDPVKGAFTRLAACVVTTAGTAHVLTVLRALNKTTLTVAAPAATPGVLNIAANPGNYPATVRTADNLLADNDRIVIELADGSYMTDIVASIDGLEVTMTAALPTLGALKGATVWHMGVEADVNPNNGLAHPAYTLTASVANKFGDTISEGGVGWVGTIPGLIPGMTGRYEPLLLIIDNGTAASVLERVVAVYTSK